MFYINTGTKYIWCGIIYELEMRKNITIKDHSISQEEFQLVYDNQLEYYITQPVPDNLSKYYESESYISHTDANNSFQDKIYQFVKGINLNSKIKLISKYNTQDKTLLDIGAGTGDFLKEANKAGWRISGIEPNPKARELAAKKGIQLKPSLENLTQEKYDVITLWHVLEHLPNLPQQIQNISALLKSGGKLIIAVPNFKSFDAQHYGAFWAAYDVPRHLYHFSQNSINRLFSKYDYSLIATKPMFFDAYYVSLLSEKYKTGKSNYFRAFLMGSLSNLKAMGTKEHSSVIYILKKD